MTTSNVRELRRLSPHGAILVAPARSAQSTSARGQNLGAAELIPDRGDADRDNPEPRR
jgi:hypothetical protein